MHGGEKEYFSTTHKVRSVHEARKKMRMLTTRL
jgi:hypothetical protein